jgi:hypothetical protein
MTTHHTYKEKIRKSLRVVEKRLGWNPRNALPSLYPRPLWYTPKENSVGQRDNLAYNNRKAYLDDRNQHLTALVITAAQAVAVKNDYL